MVWTKKRCVIKKTVRVVCPDDCQRDSSPCKKKKRKLKKKSCCSGIKRRVTKLSCPKPKIRVKTKAPKVKVSTKTPKVYVDTVAPIINVDSTPPIVNVKVEQKEDDCIKELRAELEENIGKQIEIILSAGAGGGGEIPNRLGIVESVGKGTFTLLSRRSPEYGPDSLSVIYSICKIIGFVESYSSNDIVNPDSD